MWPRFLVLASVLISLVENFLCIPSSCTIECIRPPVAPGAGLHLRLLCAGSVPGIQPTVAAQPLDEVSERIQTASLGTFGYLKLPFASFAPMSSALGQIEPLASPINLNPTPRRYGLPRATCQIDMAIGTYTLSLL